MTSILSTEFWLKFSLANAAVGESTSFCTPGGVVGVVCVDLKGRLVIVCGRSGEEIMCVGVSVVMVVAVVVLVLVLVEVVVVLVVEEVVKEGDEAEADMEAAAAFKRLEPDTVELVTGDTSLVCRVSTSTTTAVAGGDSMVVEAVAATGGRTITVVAGVGTGSAAGAAEGTTTGVGAVKCWGRFSGRNIGGLIEGHAR